MNTFHELEDRWGAAAALHYLLEVEKAANIPSWTMMNVDTETRFAHACNIHNQACAANTNQAMAA